MRATHSVCREIISSAFSKKKKKLQPLPTLGHVVCFRSLCVLRKRMVYTLIMFFCSLCSLLMTQVNIFWMDSKPLIAVIAFVADWTMINTCECEVVWITFDYRHTFLAQLFFVHASTQTPGWSLFNSNCNRKNRELSIVHNLLVLHCWVWKT